MLLSSSYSTITLKEELASSSITSIRLHGVISQKRVIFNLVYLIHCAVYVEACLEFIATF